MDEAQACKHASQKPIRRAIDPIRESSDRGISDMAFIRVYLANQRC
jgi:hypothetical protein